MKTIIKTALLLLGTCGFFGFIYPELVLNDTNLVVENQQKADQWTLLKEIDDIEVRFEMIEFLKKKED